MVACNHGKDHEHIFWMHFSQFINVIVLSFSIFVYHFQYFPFKFTVLLHYKSQRLSSYPKSPQNWFPLKNPECTLGERFITIWANHPFSTKYDYISPSVKYFENNLEIKLHHHAVRDTQNTQWHLNVCTRWHAKKSPCELSSVRWYHYQCIGLSKIKPNEKACANLASLFYISVGAVTIAIAIVGESIRWASRSIVFTMPLDSVHTLCKHANSSLSFYWTNACLDHRYYNDPKRNCSRCSHPLSN